ncbi:MAG TPA: GntR family transcriptional regulator [Aggregatilineales bacterium]|nr:GntR family transcriptional regulator [Aggregatilineales bacterium]
MAAPGKSLNHIDNKPLRDRVLDALRDAIVSAELKPGEPLIELELSAQLGVSRAPLREAIQILSREGLVETIPYRGAIVRNLSRRDIEELYSLRSVLESFAVQRIIERNDAEQVTRLRAVFESMLTAAQGGDLKAVNNIDREFHDTLIELSDHNLLVMTWSSVSMRVRQVMALRNRRNSDITRIAYNHLPIIEAIQKANEAEALRLIREHVASSGDLLAENWDTVMESLAQ